MKVGLLISLALWAAILSAAAAMQGCSLKTEIGWHGETAKDDRQFTDKEEGRYASRRK